MCLGKQRQVAAHVTAGESVSMADYAALDSHSRNCASCRRQREAEGGRTRRSLQEGRPAPCTSRPAVRRSNSTLSTCSSEGRREEGEAAAYLTPTQRRNQEVRRLRLELGRVTHRLEERDKEVVGLRRQLLTLRAAAGRMDESWSAETEASTTDSGNCDEEELVEGATDHVDFELMEATLREEEETRQRLEEEMRGVREELEEAREQAGQARAQLEEGERRREEEVRKLRRVQEEEELEERQVRSQREAELVRELAESSLRCARQQEAIERAAARQEELAGLLQEGEVQVAALRDQVARLQGGGGIEEQEEVGEKRLIEEVRQRVAGEETRLMEELAQRMATEEEQAKAEALERIKMLKQETEDESKIQRNEETKEAGSQSETTETDCEYLKHTKEAQESSSQTEAEDMKQCSCLNNLDVSNSAERLEDVSLVDEARPDERMAVTYQFLRRSVFYFLTDKTNSAYHLRTIQRLLDFSDKEREAIDGRRPKQRY